MDLIFDADKGGRRNGFILDRQVASIGQKGKKRHFVERVAMVTLTMGISHHTNFSITVLTDEAMTYKHRARPMREVWEMYGMRPEMGWSGITQFLVEVQHAFHMSAEAWEKTLDSIDKLVQVSVSLAFL